MSYTTVKKKGTEWAFHSFSEQSLCLLISDHQHPKFKTSHLNDSFGLSPARCTNTTWSVFLHLFNVVHFLFWWVRGLTTKSSSRIVKYCSHVGVLKRFDCTETHGFLNSLWFQWGWIFWQHKEFLLMNWSHFYQENTQPQSGIYHWTVWLIKHKTWHQWRLNFMCLYGNRPRTCACWHTQ